MSELDLWVCVVEISRRQGRGNKLPRLHIRRHRHRHNNSVRVTVEGHRGGGTVHATFRRKDGHEHHHKEFHNG